MFFVFEGLWWKFFGALEAWIRKASLDLWFIEVSGRFWAWFQWPLRSRQVVQMILLWMFPAFKAEVLEVPGGFRAWFQQSFSTSECFWIFSDATCALDGLVYVFQDLSQGVLVCWNALGSLHRSLRVGERHMAESDWWHISQLDWSAYVIAYTRWIAYVIAYMCWTDYVITYMCRTAYVIAYMR